MIPTVDDLGSSPMTHRPADMFNPPGLTNFLGCVQTEVDPVALANLNFPPLAGGDTASGHLFLDGFFGASGQPVTFTWYPDRVERTATVRGFEVTSTTVLVWGATAAVVTLRIENVSRTDRDVRGGIAIQGGASHSEDGWLQPLPPREDGHRSEVDRGRRGVVVTAPSGATSVQGLVGSTGTPDSRGVWFDLSLKPGESWEAAYIHAMGEDRSQALKLFDRVASDAPAQVALARAEWDQELAAVFTPGNDRYSGSLPVLETTDPDLARLYYTGVLGVVYFKRESPHSVVGRTYDTLMPRYWQTVTFLWDYALSSTVHALLDPAVMRGHLKGWMSHDVHSCFGTEWLTGGPVGVWYSVNDHAMCQMINEYLTWTGSSDWLQEPVASEGGDTSTVAAELQRYAVNWRRFATDHGLADYGGIGNLLECVSTYVHEVAALNAANVWNLRTAADHLGAGDAAIANEMRTEADDLVKRLWPLYADGEGWFHARQPDGSLLPVRHCYDLLMVLGMIPDDIGESRRSEMVEYFRTQLQTPTWMRALSPEDPDAAFSVRPDHQWNGAYTAWPAYVAEGLYKIGREDIASDWVRGLAQTANQGPIGQAHFTEDFAPPEDGGALKASFQEPYINDWACSSGGAWARLVIRSIFGVEPDGEELTATPRLDGLDPDARLVNLRHRGKLYTVDRNGVHLQD